MFMRALTSVFNALRQGKNATQILGSVAKAAPKVGDKLAKFAAAGYTADFILSRLVSPEGKVPESMFRSDFGDYLAQMQENNKQDYNRLIKTLVTTGVGAKAVKDIFARNNIPMSIITPAKPPAPPSAPPTTITVGGRPSPSAPAQIGVPTPQTAQPIPAPRRIQTTVPATGGSAIPMPPPGGLTPFQAKVAQTPPTPQVIPSGSPIALPQQMPMAQPQPVQPQVPVGKVQPMQPQAPIAPVATPTALLASETIKNKPALGQALVKAVKQGMKKKQIMELIERNFKQAAGSFEDETGMSIEEAVDELIANKDTIEEPKKPKAPKTVRLIGSKNDKKLEDAGLKPKIKVKQQPDMLGQLTQAPSIKMPQRENTENVDKQAFIMQLQELKKLLGG